MIKYLLSLCKKYPYSELFWSVFSRIWTEYGEIRSPNHSVRMRENTDQNKSEHRPFHAAYHYMKSFFPKIAF